MPKIFNTFSTIFIHVGENTTIKYFISLKIFLKHRSILKIFFSKIWISGVWMKCRRDVHASSVVPTLYDLRDYSPSVSSVHKILQSRILEWAAISSSKGSSWPRDWTHNSGISCIADRFFNTWAIGEAHLNEIFTFNTSSIVLYNYSGFILLEKT